MIETADKTFSFAEFELDTAARRLLKNGESVPINPKAFDLLFVLVENHGQILSKSELLDKVWEGQFVEENNLTVHITALRKALGEKKGDNRFIVTVPGKGYKFIAGLERETSGEIVIENHSFSRILFEEEEETPNPKSREQNLIVSGEDQKPKTKDRTRIYLICALALVLFTGGAFVLNYQSGNRSTRNKPAVLPSLKIRSFTTAGGIPHRVAISPDGKYLAYVQRFKAQDSIWLGDLETNQSIRVTPDSDRLHAYLDFSPDGKSLYFSARDDNHPVWTLMRVSVFGGAPHDLIAGVHSAVSFSPDGKRLAFLRKDASAKGDALIVADADTGKNEQVLFRVEAPQKIVSRSAAWSPDGVSIAVGISDEQGKNCEITTIAVIDGAVNKIGERGCYRNSNLVWLRDGSGIILTVGEGEDRKVQIWLASYPSGERRKITDDMISYLGYSLGVSVDDKIAALQNRNFPKIWLAENGNAENSRQILEGALRREGAYGLAIAPDGKILYNAINGDARSIWEMNPDGTNPRQLTAAQKDSDDGQVSVTADNRFLVFESNRSGAAEIWRSNRDGSNLKQLTTGGANREPDISPDGKWVIYTAYRDGKSTLWRISIEGGEPEQIVSDETSWATVSPDGKFIACVFGKGFAPHDVRLAVYPFAGGSPLKIFEVAKHAAVYNRPRWSPDGRAIIYKDTVQGLWRQDLDKEKPEALKGFDDIRVFYFAFSPTGKLVYSGGVQMREIVVLENFR